MKKEILEAAITGETTFLLENLNEVGDTASQTYVAGAALGVAAWKGHSETVRALLDWGADVNFQDTTGKTALILAARWNHKNVVERLLQFGADRSIEDKRHRKARDVAQDEAILAMLNDRAE